MTRASSILLIILGLLFIHTLFLVISGQKDILIGSEKYRPSTVVKHQMELTHRSGFHWELRSQKKLGIKVAFN